MSLVRRNAREKNPRLTKTDAHRAAVCDSHGRRSQPPAPMLASTVESRLVWNRPTHATPIRTFPSDPLPHLVSHPQVSRVSEKFNATRDASGESENVKELEPKKAAEFGGFSTLQSSHRRGRAKAHARMRGLSRDAGARGGQLEVLCVHANGGSRDSEPSGTAARTSRGARRQRGRDVKRARTSRREPRGAWFSASEDSDSVVANRTKDSPTDSSRLYARTLLLPP